MNSRIPFDENSMVTMCGRCQALPIITRTTSQRGWTRSVMKTRHDVMFSLRSGVGGTRRNNRITIGPEMNHQLPQGRSR